MTKWVAPGTGANMADLMTLYTQHTGRDLPIRGHANNLSGRTNLRIGDGPLTAYDLTRIEYAETE